MVPAAVGVGFFRALLQRTSEMRDAGIVPAPRRVLARPRRLQHPCGYPVPMLRVEHLLPAPDFRLQRLVDFTPALVVGVIPESVVTVAVIDPARMVHDRI